MVMMISIMRMMMKLTKNKVRKNQTQIRKNNIKKKWMRLKKNWKYRKKKQKYKKWLIKLRIEEKYATSFSLVVGIKQKLIKRGTVSIKWQDKQIKIRL